MMKFNEKYNHEDFLGFIMGFLPEDFVEKEEDIVINNNRYKEITTAKILGFSKSLDVYVMEMDHGRENDPRIAIATDAFKILADHWIHKALVIFKNKESDNYRFSYLTISLDLNEKNKAVKKYSNARRYSFYLGTDAKIRTPEQQLLKGKVKDVDDLLSRFSVEVVNKQFYLEVAKHFDELVKSDGENLMLPGVSQENLNIRKSFAVRLIGRLMFCWFLKQKKSESGQLIPDGLLSSKIVSDNYYHDILEPLFFGALNTSIDSRDIRSDLFDKVPYLNGGLFNPQSDDYYDLDRETFSSKNINTLKISDRWFKDFFELLETYNFTIDENTVFDQELSVDPEMLGRIFENLLAEINPETGSSERKRTGSFYTPRQIVEYMVDQSLLEYLKTKTKIDEKKLLAMISYDLTDDAEYPLKAEEKKEIINAIESLKILDPACGSGAYPIGALQKIVYILQQIDSDCTLWLELKLSGVPELYKQKIFNEFKNNPPNYIRKLEVIKNSIFGVDIQPIAVDVSRLRCFLTLVVESEVNDSKPNRGIEPLPNLDFKFVCANTLIGLPISKDPTTINAFEDHSGISELSKIMSEYFSCNSQRKNEIRLKFSNTQKDILNRTLSAFGKNIGELTQKLTLWDPFSNTSNSWFDPEWMFGLEEKFDVVIGNPPYIKEYTNKSVFDGLRESQYYQGKMDLWYMFACVGIDFIKDNGVECFIAQNNWVTSSGASIMRSKIIKDTQIISIADFGNYKIFETAGIQTMIMVFKKSHLLEKYQIDYRRLGGDLLIVSDVSDLLVKNSNVKAEYLTPEISRTELFNKKITFSDLESEIILKKIKDTSNFHLDPQKEVAQGIVPNPDVVGVSNIKKVDPDKVTKYNIKLGDGVFVVSKEFMLKKYLSEYELNVLKPLYEPRDLSKYTIKSTNSKELIYITKSIDEKQIPHLLEHLQKYREIMDERRENKNGRLKFYQLHWPRDNSFFEPGLKILAPRKCLEPVFTLTEDKAYVMMSINVIKTDRVDQKYLVGLLNSNLIKFWLRHKGKMQGNNFQIDKEPLIDLPLVTTSKEKQVEIVNLVNKILELKKQNKSADTNNLESQIDELIMDLYGLNEEEKEVIRKSI